MIASRLFCSSALWQTHSAPSRLHCHWAGSSNSTNWLANFAAKLFCAVKARAREIQLTAVIRFSIFYFLGLTIYLFENALRDEAFLDQHFHIILGHDQIGAV